MLAARGRSELAISVVKNSVAQIAAFLYPLLVLVSLLTATTLTFALAPVYIGALFGTAVIIWQITGDGEATVFEGVALVAAFVILATVAAFELAASLRLRKMSVGAIDTPRRRIGVHRDHESYKWWALSCTSLGMLLATINSGTLIIALPDLERSLHTSLLELVWVILTYMIASTVLVLSAGRLSDQFGRKRAYVAGFLVFALASLGAGFAGNGTQLILWRIVQGIGGAFLFANSAAIVTDAFPREQLGLAMGTNTMVAAVGLVIGPVLGGALVAISWHWVFWFNVPFGIVGSLWAGAVLRELVSSEEDHALTPRAP